MGWGSLLSVVLRRDLASGMLQAVEMTADAAMMSLDMLSGAVVSRRHVLVAGRSPLDWVISEANTPSACRSVNAIAGAIKYRVHLLGPRITTWPLLAEPRGSVAGPGASRPNLPAFCSQTILCKSTRPIGFEFSSQYRDTKTDLFTIGVS